MLVTATVVRSMRINSRVALSANFHGLVVMVIILIPLDIDKVSSIYLELSSIFKERHWKNLE
jgi:hypothetical protein